MINWLFDIYNRPYLKRKPYYKMKDSIDNNILNIFIYT